MKVDADIGVLLQAVAKIRDDLLLQIDQQMKHAVKFIEDASYMSEVRVQRVQVDRGKIEGVVKELVDIFASYRFNIECDRTGEFARYGTDGDTVDKVERSHAIEQIQQCVARENTENDKVLSSIKAVNQIIENPKKELLDIAKQSFTSMRNIHGGMTDRFINILNPNLTESEDLNLKERINPLFESVFMPHSANKSVPVQKLFDFQEEIIIPEASDSNFNNFLDNELERIKKAFLDDQPASGIPLSKKSSRKQSGKLFEQSSAENVIGKRAVSIGNKKSLQTISHSPIQKKQIGTLSYKEKFEDIYFKGKNQKSSKIINKPLSFLKNGTKGFSPGGDLQDEFRSISQMTTLSKFTKQSNTAPLASFSPLFKANK